MRPRTRAMGVKAGMARRLAIGVLRRGVPHIAGDEPPDLVLVLDEALRPLHLEGARTWQFDGDVGDDPSRAPRHDDDAIGEEHGLVDLVRYEEHGLARRVPDAQELGLHELAGLCVKRGKGLVHEEDLRIDGERSREVRALLHAAGELVRVTVLEPGQTDELDVRLCTPPSFLSRDAGTD